MTERRFTDKPELNPQAVRGLAPDHPAMMQNRTLFPSTVITVTEDEPARLLVSGRNNRKLGETVAKGQFKGYSLYGLSLEERATCPDDCAVRGLCYGNGMQMARRHRIGDPDVFFDRLGMELADLCVEAEDAGSGILIRLHVLGDFPSAEYVAFWADALDEYPNLAVYGYTARRTSAWDGDEIGDAIQAVKDRFPDRFRIRWSSAVSRPDGAVVINRVPDAPIVDEGLVCPAQTDATACCASCGLCWEPAMRDRSIAFIRHGPKSDVVVAEAAMASATAGAELADNPAVNCAPSTRAVQALEPSPKPKIMTFVRPTPEARLVAPTDLRIEAAYQRDLSSRSISLIRKIVLGWDWAKFKPPICAETPEGLFIIDGQHTAIAAATRQDIKTIPVLVVKADKIEERAAAFVSQNRDRLAMSALQIFHADAAAGDKEAQELLRIAARVGASIPRAMPPKGRGKPGQVVSVADLRTSMGIEGQAVVERIFRVAVMAQRAPMARVEVRALRILLGTTFFADIKRQPDSAIANALKSIKDIDAASRKHAADTGQAHDRACAMLIAEAVRQAAGVAA